MSICILILESPWDRTRWFILIPITMLAIFMGPHACAQVTQSEEHLACDESPVDHGTEAATLSREHAQIVGSPIKVTNGQMVVIRQPDSPSPSRELLIHFHGAVETVRTALARSTFRGTLVVLNFPGLSTAYSKPFEQDADLFDTIIRHAVDKMDSDARETTISSIALSSFSAGYGAIRQILKTPRHFDRVVAIVTADSIYAGLDAESPERLVSEENMRDFLRFARLATRGDKIFTLSHSA